MRICTDELKATNGRRSTWRRGLKKSLGAGLLVTALLAAALTVSFLPAAATAAGETMLVPGQTYYFDLSAKYDDIRCLNFMNSGSINADYLPDGTLHYVPFTYAGAVTAYALPSDIGEPSTEENVAPYTANRVLFLAEHTLSTQVTWHALNDRGLIYGVDYTAGGVNYLLRAPSGGSAYINYSIGAIPATNEWDVLNRQGFIKNFFGTIVQDYAESAITSMRVVRGTSSTNLPFSGMDRDLSSSVIGFRPVLEVRNADSTTLKAVTLKLNGGSLNSSAADLLLAVKTGASFNAPASQGLTPPAKGSAIAWRGDDGNLYSVGAAVPGSVNTLTAEYGYAIVNTLDNIETSNPDSYRTKTSDEDYVTTLSPKDGYKLPDTLTVTVGGIALSSGNSTYTYDSVSGQLRIKAAAINDDVVITASGVDIRKPVLTGSATRTSDLTATVKFTSDEAGVYYYAMAEHGAQAPSINTSGSGTPCYTYEQTIYLEDLGNAGAKDLYVVVKDAMGNESDPLHILIAVYSAKDYDILATPASLDFGSREAGYGTQTGAAGVPPAQTVTVTNTGNKEVTFALPQLKRYIITAATGFTNAAATLTAGQTAAFTVQPIDSMPVQDTPFTLVISGRNVSLEVPVRFQVTPIPETFSLPVGETYYFNLSAFPPLSMAGSTINANLPDQTLHYVPFTYAGTVKAYSLSADQTTGSIADATIRSLFIADRGVKSNTSWTKLNSNGLIYGTSFTSSGVTYTFRAPSGGNNYDLANGYGKPYLNEWDAILDKCNQDSSASEVELIKNWKSDTAWAQETSVIIR